MTSMHPIPGAPNGRVAIVDGCRTPFAKAGTALAGYTSLELARMTVETLAERSAIAPDEVTSVVLGSVYVPEDVPYLGRQTALALGWESADGHSAECACATGARTVVHGAYQILGGEHEAVIAGGAESLSHRPIEAPAAARALATRRPRDEHEAMQELLSVTLGDLVPPAPAVTEPYSGRTLLDHAEDMMADWGVTRAEADAFGVRSHQRAAAAWREGRIDGSVIEVPAPEGGTVRRDTLVREDASLEAAERLRPVGAAGLITAAGASPLTDGASAVLLMSERAAEASGREPLAFVRSWAFTGQPPGLGALIGPAFALHHALRRAGLTLEDLDLVDLHEAFAGQVLANLRAMRSAEFATDHLDGEPLGEIPDDKLNVNGGSIALGHPFGATGGRLIIQSADELRRRGGRHSALAICAGGARGAAVILEAP